MQWSDYAFGNYSTGWHCKNFHSCEGAGSGGMFRWFCLDCQEDFCHKCGTHADDADSSFAFVSDSADCSLNQVHVVADVSKFMDPVHNDRDLFVHEDRSECASATNLSGGSSDTDEVKCIAELVVCKKPKLSKRLKRLKHAQMSEQAVLVPQLDDTNLKSLPGGTAARTVAAQVQCHSLKHSVLNLTSRTMKARMLFAPMK